MISINYDHCGSLFLKSNSGYNKAVKAGLRLFCDRKCAGLGRRILLSPKQISNKKSKKRLYDIKYREVNKVHRKKLKAEYFQRTYDPLKASKERKTPEYRKMHKAYLRQPKWVKYKHDYDKEYLAKKAAGEYWESWLLCHQILLEFRKQVPDPYERLKQKGLLERIRYKKQLLN